MWRKRFEDMVAVTHTLKGCHLGQAFLYRSVWVVPGSLLHNRVEYRGSSLEMEVLQATQPRTSILLQDLLRGISVITHAVPLRSPPVPLSVITALLPNRSIFMLQQGSFHLLLHCHPPELKEMSSVIKSNSAAQSWSSRLKPLTLIFILMGSQPWLRSDSSVGIPCSSSNGQRNRTGWQLAQLTWQDVDKTQLPRCPD